MANNQLKKNTININSKKNDSVKNKTTNANKQVEGKTTKSVSNSHYSKGNIDFLDLIIDKYAYLIVVTLAVLVYLQTLSYGFVDFDDRVIVEDIIKGIGGLSHIGAAFTQSYQNFYRPLQNVTFLFDMTFGSGTLFWYHFTNLIIHCITCCCIIVLFRLLNYNNSISLLVGILYAVHPVFNHAVIWIASRGDLLLCLFGVLTFIMFIKFEQTKNWGYYILNIITLFLAALSKETALVFPVVIVLYVLLISKKYKINAERIALIIGWIVVLAGWYVMRNKFVGTMPAQTSFGLMPMLNNLPAAPELITKLFLPFFVSVLPTFKLYLVIIGIAIFIVALILFFIKKDKRLNFGIFGLLWFFMFLLPTLVFRLQQAGDYFDYIEHRSYLPMIGFIIFLLEIIPKKWFDLKNAKFAIINILIIIFFSAVTFVHSKDYKDSLTFWNTAIKESPGRAWYYSSIAKLYSKKENIDEAEKYYKIGLEKSDKYADLYDGLAGIYYQKKKYDAAVTLLYKALGTTNATNEVFNNFGALLNIMKRYDESISISRESLSRWQNNTGAVGNLAKAYSNKGLIDSAMYFANLMSNGPQKNSILVDVFMNSGLTQYNAGNPLKAIELTKRVLEYEPNNRNAYNNLGTYYFKINDRQNAEAMWKKSIEVAPNFPDAYNNLFIYYVNLVKNYKEAAKYAKLLMKFGIKISPQNMELIKPYM